MTSLADGVQLLVLDDHGQRLAVADLEVEQRRPANEQLAQLARADLRRPRPSPSPPP